MAQMRRMPEQIACRHNFSKWKAHHVIDVHGGRTRIYVRVCRLCAMMEKIDEPDGTPRLPASKHPAS